MAAIGVENRAVMLVDQPGQSLTTCSRALPTAMRSKKALITQQPSNMDA